MKVKAMLTGLCSLALVNCSAYKSTEQMSEKSLNDLAQATELSFLNTQSINQAQALPEAASLAEPEVQVIAGFLGLNTSVSVVPEATSPVEPVPVSIKGMSVVTSRPLIQKAYDEFLPGCLNQARFDYWTVYLRDNANVYGHFLDTVRAASTPETLTSCNDFTPGSEALKQSITRLYDHYLPGCLNTKRMEFWVEWFTHPTAKGIDFVLTLQMTASPEVLKQCAAGG